MKSNTVQKKTRPLSPTTVPRGPIPAAQPSAATRARSGPSGRQARPTQGKESKLAHTPAGLPKAGPQELDFEDSIPLFSKAGPAGNANVNPGNAMQLNAPASASAPQKLEFEDSFPLFSKGEPAAMALVKHAGPRNRNQTILLIEDD